MATASNAPLPATLDMSADDNKQTLESAASKLLFGRDVSLLASAFSVSNTVSIERKEANDSRGLPMDGRQINAAKPIVLSLWVQEQQCWLKREDTGEQVLLDGLRCSPKT